LEDQNREKEAEVKAQYLKQYMTSEARYRLNNLKMVRADLATTIENRIVQLAINGELKHPVTDEELKSLLMRMQEGKRDFKIYY
jgi:programmed cell death protein 5